MLDATAFTRPNLSSFCRLDELGLVVVGQRLEPKRAVLACRSPRTTGGVAGAVMKDHRGTA